MAAFLKWYLGKLQTQPLSTNIASAMILMSASDVSAQTIQSMRCNTQDQVTAHEGFKLQRPRRTQLQEIGESLEGFPSTQGSSTDDNLESPSFDLCLPEVDYLRLGTMTFWAVGVNVPLSLLLFKLYDKIFSKKTTLTILARVVTNFILSIPFNAAFFAYGTIVTHAAECICHKDQWRRDLESLGLSDQVIDEIVSLADDDKVDFDIERLYDKIHTKIASDLVPTLTTSAQTWIPLNYINFSFVPVHVRPLVVMGASAVWNCYLSLVQYGEAAPGAC